MRKGRCQPCLAGLERAREVASPWRAWYRTPRWSSLRRAQLRQEPLCRACHGAGVLRVATDVDHVVPHRGDATRFWDRSNLQSLCASCHSAKTGRGA